MMKSLPAMSLLSLKSLLLLLLMTAAEVRARTSEEVLRPSPADGPPERPMVTSAPAGTAGQHQHHHHQHQGSSDDHTSSCLDMTCGRGRRCHLSNSGPSCVCVEHCPDHYKPVCGSDGMIYPNHCHLHRRACLDRRHIGPRRMESCLSPPAVEEKEEEKEKEAEKEKAGVNPQSRSNQERSNVTAKPTSQSQASASTSDAPIGAETTAADVTTEEDDVMEIRPNHICSLQKFQKMKDLLLAYSREELERQSASGRSFGREYTISRMFSQYDLNNDGQLQPSELRQSTEQFHLGDLTPGCDLTDLGHFDDTSGDNALDINEFYVAFNKLYSIALVSLDKALEVNLLSALVGDNVEIKCDVTGSPTPHVIWKRSGRRLSSLRDSDSLRVFPDGSLYLSHVTLIHAGNYTCHAEENGEVQQTHVLTVQAPPTSEVNVRLQNRSVGQVASVDCHVDGVPTPQIAWLKNETPISRQPGHYDVTAGGSRLVVGPVSVSDTGAYMCEASSVAGRSRSVSSLLVQQEQQQQQQQGGSSSGRSGRHLMLFHDWGVSLYSADSCRLEHKIQGSDIIPGTQDPVCGAAQRACSWGSAVAVGSVYVYVSQPRLQRVLLISRQQLLVVDVLKTDQLPVQLEYVPHLDQVWLLNWRSESNGGVRTVEVIRGAGRRRRHYTAHLQPVNNHVDLVANMLLPPPHLADQKFRYSYVTHSNHRGMFKVDMKTLNFVKSVDLTPYNCVPQKAQFARMNGFVVLSCQEPVTSRDSGQLLYDQLTDSVVSAEPNVHGEPYLTPDSAVCVSVERPGGAGGVSTLSVQRLDARGLRFAFDVRTPLNVSDITFHPSRSGHGYDLYATAAGVTEVMFIDLQSGQVEILTSVGSGHRQPPPAPHWGRPERPLRSAGRFQRHLSAIDGDTLMVLNGDTHTENCRVAGLQGLATALWLDPLGQPSQ